MPGSFKNTQMQEAMRAFQENGTPENTQRLMECLLTTRLLAPAEWDKDPVMDENGQMVFEPDTKFQLLLIETDTGDQYFPLFTDMQELEKWDKNHELQSLVMEFDQYIPFVEMGQGQVKGIVIDPYGASLPFDSDFLLNLQHQTDQQLKETTVKEGDDIRVRKPVRNVDKFVARLRELGADSPDIDAIYLKERLVKNKPSHWLVIVDMETENTKLFQKLGEGCRGMTYGKDMEFAFAKTQIGQELIKDVEPIYVKEPSE
ncbi:MAG: enhanced serine sensitivity protein SseB C-terminal domain-containing protein [Catenisphaera adipataccumulans]|jgi:hypothetical protein|uniref:enhanced serine sensitivity protein SseB C-terminal domain-containing protein n=1 Tax=Catenisphaera adipataccumulans TaxID=700500 RepID=UPI003D8FF1F4